MLVGFSVVIVGDEGGVYLDSKEAQVVELSDQAYINYNQRCELLATCNNPSNCSHSVCGPLLGDLDDLICTPVLNNTYCPAAENGKTPCTSMNLDYKRGYVRVAASTSLPSVDTMLSICSQRELDPVMKSFTSTDLSSFTRSYFASMDGSWRVLPGSARSDEHCRDYDPRNRLWFRTSTSVVKVVTVLIDLAASMNSNLPTSFGPGSMLQAAKTIASQLLPTLSADDHVNMIVFNSTGAYQLSPEAILVKDHDTTSQPELQPLLDELNNQTVEDEYRQSNLTAAILTALPNFDSDSTAAKVILVLTDGVFATLGNVTLPTAKLSGVKVFLYKLPRSNDTNDSLSNSTLTQQLCAVGGHFEPIRKNLENPLLVLSKYFSYLANLKRIETNGKPQYSAIYQDFEHIGGNITSVSKPTFSAEGDLIGVAGMSLYLDLMGNLTNPVKNALLSRVTGYSAPTQPIILTAANCTVVNETTQPCGASTAYYAANGGLCAKTDLTSTIENLACCGACKVANGSGKSRSKGLIIGLSVIGPVVVLMALGVGGYVFLTWRKRKRAQLESDKKLFEFPGDSRTPEEPRSPVRHFARSTPATQ